MILTVGTEAAGQSLALIATFIGIGILVSVMVVYILVLVLAERKQNRARGASQ